jgi:hypothetical protein
LPSAPKWISLENRRGERGTKARLEEEEEEGEKLKGIKREGIVNCQ